MSPTCTFLQSNEVKKIKKNAHNKERDEEIPRKWRDGQSMGDG